MECDLSRVEVSIPISSSESRDHQISLIWRLLNLPGDLPAVTELDRRCFASQYQWAPEFVESLLVHPGQTSFCLFVPSQQHPPSSVAPLAEAWDASTAPNGIVAYASMELRVIDTRYMRITPLISRGHVSPDTSDVGVPRGGWHIECPLQHAMEYMPNLPPEYRWGVVCDRCDRVIQPHHGLFHCNECQFDICMPCSGRGPGDDMFRRLESIDELLLGDAHHELVAYVSSVAVDPSWQGMGVGKALMAKAMELGIALSSEGGRQPTAMMLHVSADNPRGLRLYERVGFVSVRTIPKFYTLAALRPDGTAVRCGAFLMRRDLPVLPPAP